MKLMQEIFSVGIWNGMKFVEQDLLNIESSFGALKDVLKIPLKLGHDDEQPLTDGLPAIGWVEEVKYNKDKKKLEAVFDIVSDKVIKAIEMNMYRTVSVELDVGVTYKEKQFEFVLTGVALLGAELPAVNNLNDLGKFDRSVFTKSGETLHFNLKNFKQEDDNMDEIEKLKKQMQELQDTIEMSKQESDQIKAENETLKAEKKQAEAEKEELKFTTAKSAIETSMEKLVKANKVLPAVREDFVKDIDKDNIDAKTIAAEMMFKSLMGKDEKAFDSEEEGLNKDEDQKQTFSADQKLHLKAKEIQLEKKDVSYSDALEFAKTANPELAREWLDMDGFQSHVA